MLNEVFWIRFVSGREPLRCAWIKLRGTWCRFEGIAFTDKVAAHLFSQGLQDCKGS